MSTCTRLLFLLVLILGSNDGSDAQHDANAALAAKSAQSWPGEDFHDKFRSRGYRFGNGDGASWRGDPNSKGRIKKVKDLKKALDTASSFFDKLEDLSRYERIKLRILYELGLAFERLNDWLFNNAKYEQDKKKDGCRNDMLENAILGAIISSTLLFIQFIIHVIQTSYYKRKIQNAKASDTERKEKKN